jgi:dephospho-CoA kinase
VKLIGLTGGIASGKSTIGRRLEQLGAVRIDADELAREAVAPGSPGLASVLDRFGEHLRREDGTLDRAALGAIVFGDAEALEALNGIVHPEVRRLFAARAEAARDRDPDAVVVYEVPLLVEAARDQGWDLVVVAETPAEQRIERMVELRGMNEADARSRIGSQASDAERRAVADVIIDTSGTRAATQAQVDALWRSVTSG